MRVHFIGIGGVGMAGLAVLMKRRGHEVSGCDVRGGARTRWLASLGIPVSIGHDARHVTGRDLVIVTPAVAQNNPEYLAAADERQAYDGRRAARLRRRGEVLAELVSGSPDSIAVCGSHGKTTTATFIAKLLLALGENVEWAIGGETGDFPVAGASENSPSPVLVVEADESDGTLAEYRAKTLVVTNCDYDHPDRFPTRADYLACYDAARAKAGEVIEGDASRLHSPVSHSLAGILDPLAAHNRLNALLAVEVAIRRGHDLDAIRAALPSVVAQLPDRRFQPLAPGVYTDYAHHPTEMACAVAMARAKAAGRVTVLFQPHRYSRTKALLGEFPAAFREADEVVLCPTYAAFEAPVEGGDVADLYAACRAAFADGPASPRLYLARSCAEAWEHARNTKRPGDVTLLLGAGDIIDLKASVVPDGGVVPASVKRIWIGQGTNTWRSDLRLDVEYIRTSGPAGRAGAELLREPSIAPLIPWMAGIPGTLGGWIKMNAGAFGHSISEALEAVKTDGKWLPAAECGFAYRKSALVGEIQDARFKPVTAAAAGNGRPEDYLARRKRFPAGTKGSVFKNPSGDHAGRLLEAAGAKGLKVGGAYVWEEHANVIASGPGATASDFLALARLMAGKVRHRFGVLLEPEVAGLVI